MYENCGGDRVEVAVRGGWCGIITVGGNANINFLLSICVLNMYVRGRLHPSCMINFFRTVGSIYL